MTRRHSHRIRRARTRAARRAADYVVGPTSTERVCRLDVATLNAPQPLVFTADAMRDIYRTVGSLPAEHGGPLGGARGSGVVEHFHHDTASARTRGTYYPSVDEINRLMRERWNPDGINLLGFVHSHPSGYTRPSGPDAEYAARILAGIPELDRFLLPIVQTVPDTRAFSLRGFAAVREPGGVRVEELDVHVLPPTIDEGRVWPEFARVYEAYDMAVMARSRLVLVGSGGGAAFAEDAVRAGVGEIVLIDPDIVEAPNVATQQAYRSDIGRPKVDAIAGRLVDVSPTVRVWTVRARVEDLNDNAMRQLAVGWLPGSTYPCPAATVLCAFTDDFSAQARVHRLGLHVGVPVIGGMVYDSGRGVEVTFAASGLTRACIRCAQQSRYGAYLEEGFRNDVGSAGAPIMATARLNALKLPILLGLLHTVSRVARPEHPATLRFRRLMETIVDRNLVVASLDPDIHESLGLRMFESISGGPDGGSLERVLWRSPTPDGPASGSPTCPDCGGTGDLSTSMGRFTSTLAMPRLFGDHRYDGRAQSVRSRRARAR